MVTVDVLHASSVITVRPLARVETETVEALAGCGSVWGRLPGEAQEYTNVAVVIEKEQKETSMESESRTLSADNTPRALAR